MALVPTASPDSLTRQLQTDPQLADCAVVERTVAGVLQHIAFVVPIETLEPGQRFRAAEEHALLSGIACTVVPLDRLPLRDDGELDEAYLRELPLPLPAAAACAEQTLRAQPGVEHAAVLVLPRKEREPRLHLDTFPCAQRGSHQGLTQAEPVPLLDGEELGASLEQARPLSLCESPALEAKADEPRTLPESLARAAARADANRLLFVEDDGSESALTPGELWQEAHSIMAGLRSAGLLAGDFVLLPVVRPRDVLPAFWGCLLGGFVPAVLPVPGSFHSATAELDKLRAVWTLLAQPTILATRTTCAALGEHLEHGARAVRVLALELLREHAPEGKPHRAQPDDVAFLSLSSGSTGVPKCIQLTHRNILSRGRAASALCQQSASDVILNWLPFDHIGSISDWHLRCIELGCSMVYCSKESVLGDPLEWLRMLERHRITHSWAPNFAYALINSALARSQGERWDLSQLKFLLTAGEAVSSRTLEELLSGLKAHGLPPTAARSAFGMAELGSGITYSQPTAERPVQALSIDRASLCVSLRELPDQHARAISFSALGPPIAGMSLRIVDGQGELVPERTIGKLHVRGSALSPGYYRNPEAKQAFLPDGWFDTGDEGFVDQGELYLTGRSKDCLILHGANYFPIEIEKVVEELPGVTVSFTAAYTVRPQHSEREQAALFFVLEPGHELGATLGEIRQRVSQRIGIQLDYIVPVEQADVPKTAIGKIQRKQLAARFEAGGFAEQLRQADLTLGNERTLPDWFASQSLRPVALRDTWRAPARRFLVLADAYGLAECLVDALGEECCLLVRASEARVSQVRLRAELQPGSRLEQAFSELAEASELELHVIDLSGY
ncbi:MAG: AMP-dependent synthetase and ligase, partial [Myxococcaceae bacterium]|nr:AMP-dependent synthetase and ligase [Myxococcaceae bacterium]